MLRQFNHFNKQSKYLFHENKISFLFLVKPGECISKSDWKGETYGEVKLQIEFFFQKIITIHLTCIHFWSVSPILNQILEYDLNLTENFRIKLNEFNCIEYEIFLLYNVLQCVKNKFYGQPQAIKIKIFKIMKLKVAESTETKTGAYFLIWVDFSLI